MSSAAFDVRDRVLGLLRLGCVVAGLGFVALSGAPAAERDAAALGLAVFAAYGSALYALLWRPLAARRRELFYRIATVADLLFVVALMALTGGASSPFYRALYLWTSMLAFNEGYRGGVVGSTVSIAVLLAAHAFQGLGGDRWELVVQTGGLLLHGPLIGILVDRERRHIAELRAAHDELRRTHDELAAKNRQLVDEQEHIVEIEKLSSVGMLAAGVAHEINNPLAGVMSCLAALRAGTVDPERRDDYFMAAREGLERIRDAVRQLLDYARNVPPTHQRIDARGLVEGVRTLLAAEFARKDLSVEVSLPDAPVLVDADPSRLKQAVLNVALNALYAAPAHGHVRLALAQVGEDVGILVEDDGPGIPRENIARVTDPFFTTKPQGEGTGLGLSVTMGIVKSHGGRLSIASEPGAGTKVSIWIPAVHELARAATG